MSGSSFKRIKRTPSPPEVQPPPQAPAAPSVELLPISLQALQQRNAELERQLLQAGVQVGVRGWGGGGCCGGGDDDAVDYDDNNTWCADS